MESEAYSRRKNINNLFHRIFSLKNSPKLIFGITLMLAVIWWVLHLRKPSSDFHVAAIVQTLVFGSGLLLTNISLVFLSKSNDFMAKQLKFTSELLTVERTRDQQANLICAWMVVSFDPEDPYNILKGDVIFSNSSNLPIYDLKIEIVYERLKVVHILRPPIGFGDNIVRVMPPRVDQSRVWHIEGWINHNGETVATQLTVFSKAVRSSEIFLDAEGVTMDDMQKLNVRIQFRCADGTTWSRDENGRLSTIN